MRICGQAAVSTRILSGHTQRLRLGCALPGAAHSWGGATSSYTGQLGSLPFQPGLVTWAGGLIHLRWCCKAVIGGIREGPDPGHPLLPPAWAQLTLHANSHRLDHGAMPVGGIAGVDTRCQFTRDAGGSETRVWGCQRKQHPFTGALRADAFHSWLWLPINLTRKQPSRSFHPCPIAGAAHLLKTRAIWRAEEVSPKLSRHTPFCPLLPPLTFHRDGHIFGHRASSIGGFTLIDARVFSGHKQQALDDLCLPRAHTAHIGRWNPMCHTGQ